MLKSLTKEEQYYLNDRVKEYFESERGEEIGDLAASKLIDYLMKEIGPLMYNKGVHDARQMVEQKVMNLDEDLLSLERPIGRSKH